MANLDKVVLKFLADVLYIKGILSFDEFEDVMAVSSMSDLDVIVERMLCSEYNSYKSAKNEKRDIIDC